jgi:very-short-patch-repair endonuclease
MEPVVALAKHLGATWWRQLIDDGVTDGALRAAVRSGAVLSVGRGAFALPDASPDVVAAARLRGRVACVSAAKLHGLDTLTEPLVPHVAVPRNRSASSERVVLHRVDAPGAGTVVPVLTSLLAVLRCLSPVEAVVVVDCAVRTRATTVSGLRTELAGPGSVEARRVLAMVDGRSESVIETVLRLALRQVGLPVDCQVRIPGVGRVDLLVGGWLVVEADGFAFHAGRAQYRVDRQRANTLVGLGLRVLRVTYEDVLLRLPETVARIASVYRAGR